MVSKYIINAGMVKQTYKKCSDGEANIKEMQGW
jgi:hypothetical protein